MQIKTPITFVVHLYRLAYLVTTPGFAVKIAFIALFPLSSVVCLTSIFPAFTIQSSLLTLDIQKECRLSVLLRKSRQR